MKRKKFNSTLLSVAAAFAVLTAGAGVSFAAHQPVKLYTFEEVAMQYGVSKMPVVIEDTDTMQGFPYSPKQSCGTADCHAEDYAEIVNHSFHVSMAMGEWNDTPIDTDPATAPIKPWVQTNGMWGKW